MTSFLHKVLSQLQQEGLNLSQLIFVLPSKRAGSFLQKEISFLIDQPVFAPKVLSIEDFAENISGLKPIDNISSLFKLYEVFRNNTAPGELENFEEFANWAQTLIHDFNEIDRYLIPPDSIFNYLSEIQDQKHWFLAPEKTELVKNYLSFWRRLPVYYKILKEELLKNSEGYQGLIYRQAAENIQEFAQDNAKHYIFLGFNALNEAEQKIMQEMLANGSRIFWDIDKIHFEDSHHDASHFIREYATNWPFYKNNTFETISTDYIQKKDIDIAGVPKIIGQAKHVGEILSQLSEEQLNKTALVLGDENLLVPVLNSMPPNIENLNITMGYPLKFSSLFSLFSRYFELLRSGNSSFYYKDIIGILNNPEIRLLLQNQCDLVIERIRNENLNYLDREKFRLFFPIAFSEIISVLFPGKGLNPGEALQNFEILISHFKLKLKKISNSLELEFLYQFHTVFIELKELVEKYPHIQTIDSLFQFFKELVGTKTLDFKGTPFQGLQLMGMLESRVLDFETVILTSVNEGILPAGKSSNSFIPYDLKKTYKLPTYKEKDAIYTYHFYHLLQRAKRIFILHDSNLEGGMGGEKSRLLMQLEIEKQEKHKIRNYVVVPKVPKVSNDLIEIGKTPEIMQRIKELAARGFSPSALTTYVRNPLDFYNQYILGVRDSEEVEETVAYNTLGTVVHNTLENLYKPCIGRLLTEKDLENFLSQTEFQIKNEFEKCYSKLPLKSGKNLLIFEVAKRYVQNFLKKELQSINAGNQIFIKQIETKLGVPLQISSINFTIGIQGKVDRVDVLNGISRVIDYKTGKVEAANLKVKDWENYPSDYDKHAKSFQVLCYAYMMHKSGTFSELEAGVISFKNLAAGFMKFEKDGDSLIDGSILAEFEKILSALLIEICDPKLAFIEKEIKVYGNY